MKTCRKTSIIVGILFILGTLSGFMGASVIGTVLEVPSDLARISAGSDRLTLGALLLLVMGLALAMVPVLMYPIFKKHNETMALGYIVFRGALETAACIASVVGFLALGTLGREFIKAGAPAAAHFQSLVALLLGGNDWIIAMGYIVFSLGAFMFYSLLFKSGLLPRWLSVWGFAGAAAYLAESLFFMFGFKWEFLFYPLALQEMVMAVWLIVRGFNRSALACGAANQGAGI
ncbi:MAG: DUF4386 domain-containing protein [Christensenellales bacterium]